MVNQGLAGIVLVTRYSNNSWQSHGMGVGEGGSVFGWDKPLRRNPVLYTRIEDLGPVGIYLMGGILLLNLAFIAILYKELKLATFDSGLAVTLGFAPALIHYLLMGLVSVTAVSAFEVVGSVLLVALMVAPPITAYRDRL